MAGEWLWMRFEVFWLCFGFPAMSEERHVNMREHLVESREVLFTWYLKKRGKNQKKKNLFLTKLALFTVGILPVIHFFESYVQFKEVFTLS